MDEKQGLKELGNLNELPSLDDSLGKGSQEITEEQIIDQASEAVRLSYFKVAPQIDKLSSANLKRVIKAISHVGIAEELLTSKKQNLNENEQKLIDSLHQHMENTMILMQILNQKNNEGESNE